MSWTGFLRSSVAVLCALMLPGCTTLGYYAQAVHGHLDVMWRAQPISRALEDPSTPAVLKARLRRVLEIRDFATRELGLPDNGSYRSYADLHRPFVLWNVFAAPEFSVKPVESCFPFAGCVTYRGFYDEQRARAYATELRGEGLDTFVGGVPAYSTLGYFDDPVLNTFVNLPEPEVARLIFHELAHQVVYVRGDTVFNESFASAVEEEGLQRWLDRHGTSAQRDAWRAYQKRRREFVTLVERYRGRLATLYADHGPDVPNLSGRRDAKAALFREMRDDYQVMRRSWQGYEGYDRYFGEQLNNALLAAIAAYARWVPAFQALISRDNADLPAFYRDAEGLGQLPKDQREQVLQALGEAR